MNRDAQDLRWLVLAHYGVGLLTTLLASIPALGIWLGVHLSRHPKALGEGYELLEELNFPAEFVGQMVVYASASAVLLVLLHGIVVAWVGWCIAEARRYWVVYIFSLLDCTYVPLGTILGVWAVVVLRRPSIRARFGVPVRPARSKSVQPAPVRK